MVTLNRLSQNPIFFYTGDIPSAKGFGVNARVYTNLRAYLDNGFRVHIIYFAKPGAPLIIDDYFPDKRVTWELLNIFSPQPNWTQRFAHWSGFPRDLHLNSHFPERELVQKKVMKNETRSPGAVHHFEYLGPATAIIGMSQINSIWSCHDLEVDRYIKRTRMRQSGGNLTAHNLRRISALAAAEKQVLHSTRLALMIAEHEMWGLREKYKLNHIHLLPMSLPDEKRLERTRQWGEKGKLKLLHLGKLEAMMSYHSMKYLIEKVLPGLSEEILSRLEIWVAGGINQNKYCQEILALASKYSQIHFLDFVEDLDSLYATMDIQIVGGTVATGLRTRIIEFMCRGLPVLSTIEAARGIMGMRNGQNILLATTPGEFIAHLIQYTRTPPLLQAIADRGIQLYEMEYSRKKAAEQLSNLLETYMQ